MRSSSMTVGMPRSTTRLPLPSSFVDQELRGVVADGDIVAGNIEILDVRIVQATIDDGDECPLLLDRLDGRRQFLGGVWQDDQCVQLAARRQSSIALTCARRGGRGLDDDFDIREGRVDLLGRGIGVIDDTGGPAVVGCGYRDRDRLLLVGRSRTGTKSTAVTPATIRTFRAFFLLNW